MWRITNHMKRVILRTYIKLLDYFFRISKKYYFHMCKTHIFKKEKKKKKKKNLYRVMTLVGFPKWNHHAQWRETAE